MKPYLLYIDIASIVDDNDPFMEITVKRKGQFIDGIKKLLEYDFKHKACDIMITDNTCDTLYPEIDNLLPEGTIRRCFTDNQYGSKNKGAGLVQKWMYNKELIESYEWIIYFEGRQLLRSFSFFDRFFNNPQCYFAYGSALKNHVYTGIFSAKTEDILRFSEIYTKEVLIQGRISIEYPIFDYLRGQIQIVDSVDITWFPAGHKPINY